jgi:hypothetical protein
VIVRSWDEVLITLRERSTVPAAQASADLLARAKPTWEQRVLPDLWMHDLRFVAPGDTGTRVDQVRVAWNTDHYVFTLLDSRGLVVAADHAGDVNSGVVLDSFLTQLVGDS